MNLLAILLKRIKKTESEQKIKKLTVCLHDVDLLQDVAGISGQEKVRESQTNTSLSHGQRFRDKNVHRHQRWPRQIANCCH